MSMYFKNRFEAGQQFAEILFHPYGRSKSVVLALGEGGLLVAHPIAHKLQLPVYMVAAKEIDLPGSFKERVGTVDQSGGFVFSSDLTQGQIDDYVAEYHGHIETEKMNAMHDINSMLGHDGFVEKSFLNRKNILLVSDGLDSGIELDAVMAFLKPVNVQRLVGISPVASIKAIDKMHILMDEIRVLSPKQNYVGTNHYYEENALPNTELVQRIVTDLNARFEA